MASPCASPPSSPPSIGLSKASVSDEQHPIRWDDIRVKLMCSFGGRILPRPNDHQLRYVGGETRMVVVSRNISYGHLSDKLCRMFGASLAIKYQLPSEELDALISVQSDEDLENMMEEYDRLQVGSNRPCRLRLFLFPTKLDRQTSLIDSLEGNRNSEHWFVDALNSVPVHPARTRSETSSVVSETLDHLFGLEAVEEWSTSAATHSSSNPPEYVPAEKSPASIFGSLLQDSREISSAPGSPLKRTPTTFSTSSAPPAIIAVLAAAADAALKGQKVKQGAAGSTQQELASNREEGGVATVDVTQEKSPNLGDDTIRSGTKAGGLQEMRAGKKDSRESVVETIQKPSPQPQQQLESTTRKAAAIKQQNIDLESVAGRRMYVNEDEENQGMLRSADIEATTKEQQRKSKVRSTDDYGGDDDDPQRLDTGLESATYATQGPGVIQLPTSLQPVRVQVHPQQINMQTTITSNQGVDHPVYSNVSEGRPAMAMSAIQGNMALNASEGRPALAMAAMPGNMAHLHHLQRQTSDPVHQYHPFQRMPAPAPPPWPVASRFHGGYPFDRKPSPTINNLQPIIAAPTTTKPPPFPSPPGQFHHYTYLMEQQQQLLHPYPANHQGSSPAAARYDPSTNFTYIPADQLYNPDTAAAAVNPFIIPSSSDHVYGFMPSGQYQDPDVTVIDLPVDIHQQPPQAAAAAQDRVQGRQFV